ncbi:hypothetical protein FIBSPDRAFT_903036 [Athelia psychrophila]|uniref:Uncharacterized protein n=1 Tax=Athelia psychrophila TaxID=1759441 RepID=A0A167WH24_9AGAM|nr:hypothetical protein FIBSPDRAFT_903036 [Fibularhizoctonia sp. CBS 109695]
MAPHCRLYTFGSWCSLCQIQLWVSCSAGEHSLERHGTLVICTHQDSTCLHKSVVLFTLCLVDQRIHGTVDVWWLAPEVIKLGLGRAECLTELADDYSFAVVMILGLSPAELPLVDDKRDGSGIHNIPMLKQQPYRCTCGLKCTDAADGRFMESSETGLLKRISVLR